jgi:hypothetical protein
MAFRQFPSMRDRDGKVYSGLFQLADQQSVAGELTLNGKNSSVLLHSPEFLSGEDRSIQGVLNDRTTVSLLFCRRNYCQDSASVEGTRHYTASTAPQLVLFGEESLSAEDERVLEMHVVLEDAAILFNDYTSFGIVINAKEHIASLLKSNEAVLHQREMPNIGIQPRSSITRVSETSSVSTPQ